MRIYYLLLAFLFSVPWASYAQGTPDFYRHPNRPSSGLGFRAGFNYSVATVTEFYVNNSIPTSILGGVTPKGGFYMGGFYYKDLIPNQLTYRMEANLQLKEVGFADPQGIPLFNTRYYYAGVTPLLGLHLLNKLTVYTGPELNVLVTKANAWGKGYPIEVGATVRLTYAIGKIGAEISYFRGFTKYYRLGDSPSISNFYQHDFYNQNLQVGLIYHW